MFAIEIVLLGSALAIDAAVVTFAMGLMHLEHTRAGKIRRGLTISLTFGFFQFLMMWLGSYAGYLFTFSKFGHYFQLIVGVIFFMISIKFIQESLELEERKLEWGILPVVTLALATSIDALASGVSLGTIPRAYLASIEVGIITFALCLGFYYFSQTFTKIPDKWLLRAGGLIFFILSAEIFWGLRHIIIR